MLYKPHRDIDPVFRSTTPIKYQREQGGGTGFFLKQAGQTYVVTNRHIVDPDGVSPQRARIWIRNQEDIFNRTAIDLDLEASSTSPWYYHPDQTEIDIAIAPIDPDLSTIGESDDDDETCQTGSLAFSTDHFVHENIDFDSRVAVLGHPESILDPDSHFPIRRNALIASPYGVRFNGKPTFLTDARMHSGMSGGPVVVDSGWYSGSDIPTHRFRSVLLIGVHSETYVDPSSGDSFEEYRFDLNAAWYPKLIRDILQNDIDD